MTNTYNASADMPGYGTGLIQSWDIKNQDYPIGVLLDPAQGIVSKRWLLTDDERDNQGSDPECVGAALAQELASDPVKVAITHPYTRKNIYNLAQKLDEWPGEGYAGTSLLAGLKACKQWGYITEYRWAFSVDDVAQSLSQLGPVIMAGPWLSGMFTPDNEGHVRVTGTAGNIGHCYELGEIDAPKARVFIEQTWGPFWSVLGWRGWLSFEDVATLLRMGTQAAIITGRADPDAPKPPTPPPNPPNPPNPPKPATKGIIQLTEATGTKRNFNEV